MNVRRFIPLAVLAGGGLCFGGCANQPSSAATAPSAPTAASAPSSDTPSPVTPSSTPVATASAVQAASSALPATADASAAELKPPGLAQALDASAPSPGVGARVLKSDLEGCLAAKTRGSVAPPAPPVASANDPEVLVEARPGQTRVVHRLEHACCLTENTTLERGGKTVTLVEHLSGTPCRCRCSSVVSTTLPLEAGDYELVVRVDSAGGSREAFRGVLAVTGGEAPRRSWPSQIHVDPPNPPPH